MNENVQGKTLSANTGSVFNASAEGRGNEGGGEWWEKVCERVARSQRDFLKR